MDEAERQRIFKSCTRYLGYHYPQSPKQILQELASLVEPELEADRYGSGELIATFEQDMAKLLGKEAAVFMPSGTMCQQIALRIWSERRKSPNVAFHPTSHLELHEHQAYQRLHGLQGILVGAPERLLTLEQLKAVAEPLGAVLLELPQREIGGQLPSWEELSEISAWAHEQGIPLHMDGARLWECRPFYKREYADIAGLFDSVYVSFYKSLGGIAGSVLAGPESVIAEARIWQRRHGGNLIHLYPFVLSARKGLNDHLGQMEAYHAKAVEFASALAALPQIGLVPNPPQINMLHIHVRGEAERLQAAVLEIAQETGVWLTARFTATALPTWQKFELTVGDASLDLSGEEVAKLFQQLFEKAGA